MTGGRPRRHAGGTRRGYVFPLALWTIAIIAVLLGAAYTAMSVANATLARLQDRDAALDDFALAEHTLVTLLLTEPMGLSQLRVGGTRNPDPITGGFGEGGEPVSTTGDPYRVDAPGGPVVVRLVGVNGLINFNDDPGPAAEALLQALGKSRADAERLAARLEDFIDEDDQRRLGGAEAADYPEGRTPRNAPLSTAADACGALGWEEEVALCADPRLMDLYAFAGAPGVMSGRLAPQYLLHRLLDDETAVERAMDALENRNALVRFSDLGIEGLDTLEDNSALPGPSFLIVTHRPDARYVQLTRIDLTLASLYKPYDIAFTHIVGGSEIEGAFHVEEVGELARLPQTD